MSRTGKTSRRAVLVVGHLAVAAAMLAATFTAAGERKFSLNLDSFSWTLNADLRTKERLAEWNDPMGRMMYHFNQQQAWIQRGATPGSERVTGVAVRVKAQRGLPLDLLASTMLADIDVDRQQLARLGRRRANDDQLDSKSLEELLSEELGRRLKPQ